jgi:hypothetical protein
VDETGAGPVDIVVTIDGHDAEASGVSFDRSEGRALGFRQILRADSATKGAVSTIDNLTIRTTKPVAD